MLTEHGESRQNLSRTCEIRNAVFFGATWPRFCRIGSLDFQKVLLISTRIAQLTCYVRSEKLHACPLTITSKKKDTKMEGSRIEELLLWGTQFYTCTENLEESQRKRGKTREEENGMEEWHIIFTYIDRLETAIMRHRRKRVLYREEVDPRFGRHSGSDSDTECAFGTGHLGDQPNSIDGWVVIADFLRSGPRTRCTDIVVFLVRSLFGSRTNSSRRWQTAEQSLCYSGGKTPTDANIELALVRTPYLPDPNNWNI